MVDEAEIDRRIRERAHKLWEQEGQPEGRAASHWEQARMIVALEDGHASTLKPVEEPRPEPIEPMRNLGEFPTLTDQGEGLPYPSLSNIPQETPLSPPIAPKTKE